MTDIRTLRFREAYQRMAKEARYRPHAPGDGMGNVSLSEEQLRDRRQLDREAMTYARAFATEEDTDRFLIGCSDYDTNRAFVWTIEAARMLASGIDGRETAIRLLKLAIEDVATAPKG